VGTNAVYGPAAANPIEPRNIVIREERGHIKGGFAKVYEGFDKTKGLEGDTDNRFAIKENTGEDRLQTPRKFQEVSTVHQAAEFD
jgi:hypothetical protein